jgi:hypothetical protein
MINVKAKTQGTLKMQRVHDRTSFQVLDRVARGTTGVFYLEVLSEG